MEKNVKVGNIMEQEKIVYQNNGFIITEHPRKREYENETINENDRIYRIALLGSNQPTIDDCCELVYYLLKNKVYEHKFKEYKSKILYAIERADKDGVRINRNMSMDSWM